MRGAIQQPNYTGVRRIFLHALASCVTSWSLLGYDGLCILTSLCRALKCWQCSSARTSHSCLFPKAIVSLFGQDLMNNRCDKLDSLHCTCFSQGCKSAVFRHGSPVADQVAGRRSNASSQPSMASALSLHLAEVIPKRRNARAPASPGPQHGVVGHTSSNSTRFSFSEKRWCRLGHPGAFQSHWLNSVCLSRLLQSLHSRCTRRM